MRNVLKDILDSPNMPTRRPVVNEKFESNVRGLYIIGDLAGAPVVKLAMEQGHGVAHTIARELNGTRGSAAYDLIVAGAGAAGLNAALEAQELGLKVLVLEKNKIANTIEDFPEGKWVYAEPDSVPPKGKLWLDGATKEELIGRWHEIISSNRLEVHAEEGLTALSKTPNGLELKTTRATYSARRMILATGQRGNARKLDVPGEQRERVYHRLYSPRHYEGQDILVVGGGNSAVEAAITLAERNRVTLAYRGPAFARLFKDNQRKLQETIENGNLKVVFNSNVQRFDEASYQLKTANETLDLPYDHAFVLIGAEAPAEFLRSLGIHLENDWTGDPIAAAALTLVTLVGLWLFGGANWPGALLALAGAVGLVACGVRGSRYAWLGFSFLVAYTIYGAKQATNYEFWPYRGWGFKALSFLDRPWSFWYSVLYSCVMTVFGIRAMKRWSKDRFQIWRYVSLLSFQWIFFFLIPEFLYQVAVKYQPIAASLGNEAWRSYGLVYAWPLFFYTFFSPNQIWVLWGAFLSFVLIPVLVLFHGKRYCSWICGCGGLAETLGDRWRHLAPKGRRSVNWERMNDVVLAAAVAVTIFVLARDAVTIFRTPADKGLYYYHLIADTWLVGILPVTLYPFFGGKVWCRYWCPLARMMQMFSTVFTRFRVSRFAIRANEKCIACGECSRNCQVGINVMNYAMKQEELNNFNSSCIGCGICVTVCPMDVLSFGGQKDGLVQIT